MNKDEILRKAQNEVDEREAEIALKATSFSSLLTGCIVVILSFVVLQFFDDHVFSGTTIGWLLLTVGYLYDAVLSVYKAVRLGKRRNIGWAIFWCAFFVICVSMTVVSILL